MKLSLLLLSVFAMMLTSCNYRLYYPSTHNVPMLREQNEARAMFGYIEGEHSKGGEVQLAYSPLNHLGLTFNYTGTTGKTGSNGKLYTGNGHQIEGSCGYYLPLGQKFCFEVYGGLSNGKHTVRKQIPEYQISFTKLYVEPAIGFLTDYADVIFSTSFGHLNGRSQYTPESYRCEVLEPAFTLRAGYKFLKIQAQVNYTIPLTDDAASEEVLIYSLGISTAFAPRWKEGVQKFSKRNW